MSLTPGLVHLFLHLVHLFSHLLVPRVGRYALPGVGRISLDVLVPPHVRIRNRPLVLHCYRPYHLLSQLLVSRDGFCTVLGVGRFRPDDLDPPLVQVCSRLQLVDVHHLL